MHHYIKEIYGIYLNLINKTDQKIRTHVPDWTWKHLEFDRLGLKISSNIGGDCVGARWGTQSPFTMYTHS
jgi:hypothetical protein